MNTFRSHLYHQRLKICSTPLHGNLLYKRFYDTQPQFTLRWPYRNFSTVLVIVLNIYIRARQMPDFLTITLYSHCVPTASVATNLADSVRPTVECKSVKRELVWIHFVPVDFIKIKIKTECMCEDCVFVSCFLSFSSFSLSWWWWSGWGACLFWTVFDRRWPRAGPLTGRK